MSWCTTVLIVHSDTLSPLAMDLIDLPGSSLIIFWTFCMNSGVLMASERWKCFFLFATGEFFFFLRRAGPKAKAQVYWPIAHALKKEYQLPTLEGRSWQCDSRQRRVPSPWKLGWVQPLPSCWYYIHSVV